MATNTDFKCFLCGFKSKIPIRNNPSHEDIDRIITSAKKRAEIKCFNKYKDCEMWSTCQVNNLMNISYHRSCFKDFTRTDLYVNGSPVNKKVVIAVEDFVSNFIDNNVIKTDSCVDIKTITNEYLSSVKSSNELNTRKKIKSYLQNRCDVYILRSPTRYQSETVASKKYVESVFHEYRRMDSTKESHGIEEAFLQARNMILDEPAWQFEGVFDNFKIDDRILAFFKILIGGKNPHTSKVEYIHKAAMLLAQFTEEIILSERQVRHKDHIIKIYQFLISDLLQAKYSSEKTRRRNETPLSVGMSISAHKNFRSKKLVEELYQIGIATTYKKLLQIENDLARSIEKIEDETGGFAAPEWIRFNQFLSFAIDNIDFNEATFSGKNSLHGTVLCVFQDKAVDAPRSQIHFARSKMKATNILPYTLMECKEPATRPNVYPIDLNSFESDNYSETIDRTRLWMTTFLDAGIKKNSEVLTWSGFNSRCSNNFLPVKNIGLIAPLLRAPPTQYDALLTAIMRARKVNVHYNGPSNITVVGLDLQLYDMAMKLWTTREDIRNNFFFVAGQLHTVFWMLQNIGTYIKGSGLPQLWIESGIYSATVVEKMLAGKQMKRSIEAHTILVLALCNVFVNKKILNHPNREDIVTCIDSIRTSLSLKNNTEFQNVVKDAAERFSSLDLPKLFIEGSDCSAMEKFIHNYIKQFEVILQHIRSTRDGDVELQLTSIANYLKFFFAHNNLGYARLLPLQLHAYQKIKNENSILWKEFKENGNFVVTKNLIKFTSIGIDHGLEQEIKKLKIIGGIRGETQSDSSLDRYFTIAPALISIVTEFYEMFIDCKTGKKSHHELVGSKPSRMLRNVNNLTGLLNELEIGTETVDTPLYNIYTKEVVPLNIASDIINRDIRGEKLSSEFINDRLVNGNQSVWDPMKKSNVSTFLSTSVSVDPKKVKLKTTKEDCNWFQRFSIACRSRPDLDLRYMITTFELGSIPRSLFAHDGNLLIATDKARIVHAMEDLSRSTPVVEIPSYDVIIIDGMALLHKMKKGNDIVNCMNLSNLFVNLLERMGSDYGELHLVMDRYQDKSLKNQTRLKRAAKQPIRQFVIRSNTNIQNVTMKELLSNTRTKNELVAYLCQEALQKISHPKFCVTYGNQTHGNFKFNACLETHSHEEADTLIQLHASSVGKSCKVLVDSPDTDVLILLVHFMPSFPRTVSFRTGAGKFRRVINVNNLYNCIGRKSRSLVAFHALTGTDVTGKLCGISKETAFKRFLSAPEDITDKLQVLGEQEQSSDSLHNNVLPFICFLYQSPCATVEDTRWHLFLKQKAPEDMPPIRGVLMQHILRAHFIALIWKNSLNPMYSPPDPCDYGWRSESDSNFFMPFFSTEPICPPKLQDMITCKSCKTGCNSKRCLCYKSGMPCTEMCGCHLGESVTCNNLADLCKSEMSESEEDSSNDEIEDE